MLLQHLLLAEDLSGLLLFEHHELFELLLLLPLLLIGGLLRRGRAPGWRRGSRLEELQVLVVEQGGGATVDLEPVGTNEILLVEDCVVGAHKLKVPHLVLKEKQERRYTAGGLLRKKN